MSDFREYLVEACRTLGIEVDENQMQQFEVYKNLLVERNKVVNLTSIQDDLGIAVKHFADSLLCLQTGPGREFSSIIDIGTGPGFPGLVLKIMVPDARAVLLDSVGKKVQFVGDMVDALGLSMVEPVHGRAEDMARRPEFRERFDLAVARGVASLPVLMEYCLPFVRVGGWMIAMKGPGVNDEISPGETASRILGGGKLEVMEVSLPYDAGERRLITVRKMGHTSDKYPRKPGVVDKRPLG